MDGSPSSNILFNLLLIFILILINAFFAAAEMAIVSLNKSRINFLSEEGNKKADLLKSLLEEPSKFLATIQVGITLAGFFASAFAATGISRSLSTFFGENNIPYANKLSIVIVTLLLSYITLVLGELFPKRLALQYSEQISMFSIRPIIFMYKISLPFIKLLSASTNFLVRIFGIDTNNLEEKISIEEIRSLIEVGEEHGVINQIEKEMINGIFDFDNTLAKEIMTPRTEVLLIDIDDPIDEIVDEILCEKYSRIPVYREDIDNIIGMLYTKDLFVNIIKYGKENLNLEEILRPAYFVPETKNIDDLFKELQSQKNYMAILIDEYGGFSGIVTIEDLTEEVMGNIFDEYDINEPEISKIDNNVYIVNGLLSIDDLNENLNLSLNSEITDTIGGFVMTLLGRVPKENENKIIKYENLTFEIKKIDEKRIEKLKICINDPI
ncbi:hemolysin family protein [Hathewaya massiliensis]|uniref:hemolysin family protein n=1 Tax=Hathewaya massiliensis TaxID=1964382 RepID=UPI0011584B9C|nr:hemolysin family protein [Hathewaya massiliensis]